MLVQGGYTNPRRKRLGGDLLDDADTREQVSLKDAISPEGKITEASSTGTGAA
jgi:hypothetical protein